MEKIPFKTDVVDGEEIIMHLGSVNPHKIGFNRKTREITVYYNRDFYVREDIDQDHWRKIKNLVELHGGEWQNKEKGIKFLIGKKKVTQ